jgi:hypothetical protein
MSQGEFLSIEIAFGCWVTCVADLGLEHAPGSHFAPPQPTTPLKALFARGSPTETQHQSDFAYSSMGNGHGEPPRRENWIRTGKQTPQAEHQAGHPSSPVARTKQVRMLYVASSHSARHLLLVVLWPLLAAAAAATPVVPAAHHRDGGTPHVVVTDARLARLPDVVRARARARARVGVRGRVRVTCAPAGRG